MAIFFFAFLPEALLLCEEFFVLHAAFLRSVFLFQKNFFQVEVRLTDRVGQAEGKKGLISAHRTLFRRVLEKADFESPTICFLRIPAVSPTMSSKLFECYSIFFFIGHTFFF